MADLRNEKITYKIREHSLQKLPYQLVVGDKEMDTGRWRSGPAAIRTWARYRGRIRGPTKQESQARK